MKGILRFVGNFLAVPAAALAGNWIGGQLRFYLTGERLQTIQFHYTSQKGRNFTNAPVATKFYPGLFFALVGKPRWLFALIGGLLAGGLVPDHWEHYWLERVIEPVFVDRVLGEGENR
jgi:hypothetical protein